MSNALDGSDGRLDTERQLALSYVPAARRGALATLWRLDSTLGGLLASGSQPMVTQIKLAWWREALEALDQAPPPAEPLLQAVARGLLPAGLTGATLAEMTEGWEILLTAETVRQEDLTTYARQRGGLLFRCSAVLLGHPSGDEVECAGQAWALVDLARRSGAAEEAEQAMDAARLGIAGLFGRRWPAALRPLGMLAALARRDAGRGIGRFERQGAPARMLAMARHRLTGK
ncbi:squalene/phytoene synthase family protein [Sphingomonas sp.]|uniref:squalene/phytoene synthase family protein n=1 Tax=Sphingomonas sp. TaxID=28214 RepID=UPI002FC94D14